MKRPKEHTGLASLLDGAFQRQVNLILATSVSGESAVHMVRVCTKKIRAYLHLLKKPLGKVRFDTTNLVFRDASRTLRTYRETEVLYETISYVEGLHDRDFTPGNAERLRLDLRLGEPQSGLDEALASIHNDVHAEREALPIATLNVKWTYIATALKRTYHRNKNAFANAVRQPNSVNLHEWRKQAKRLEYQIAILQPIWPKHIDRLKHELAQLTDTLGHIHDLSILKKRLAALDEAGSTEATKRARHLIRNHRRKLLRDVFDKGHSICAKPASEFETDLNRHWENQTGLRAPLVPVPTKMDA